MIENNYGRVLQLVKQEKSKIETFALQDDRMFLNTLVIRIAKEKEVRLTTIDGSQRIGFIAGLDNEWIQLTTTEKQQLVLINIVNISIIEETGESIRSLKLDENPTLNSELQNKIKGYCQTIFVKARDIYREKQQLNSFKDHIEDKEVANV